MTSNDNYVTVEMFNAGMARLEAMNEKNLALIQKENAEFRLQLREDMNNFKNEIRSDIENFKNETRAEFSQIHSELSQVHSEIAQLDKRIEVQNARIDDLFHWNYWIIALFVATFLAPSILEAVKAFSKSLAGSIAAIFKRGNKAVNYE